MRSTVTYFAYGSNMLRKRLTDRVGEVRELGAASLRRYSLTFHKRSGDGSGKCTLVESGGNGDEVWGVLFQLSIQQRRTLDRYEGAGYARHEVTLSRGDSRLPAITYISTTRHIDPALKPFPWYKGLVVAGAIQWDLPPDYIEALVSVPTIDDLDQARVEANHGLIVDSGYSELLPKLVHRP